MQSGKGVPDGRSTGLSQDDTIYLLPGEVDGGDS